MLKAFGEGLAETKEQRSADLCRCSRYSTVALPALGALTEALMLFGVGAGIYVLSPAGGKAHHEKLRFEARPLAFAALGHE